MQYAYDCTDMKACIWNMDISSEVSSVSLPAFKDWSKELTKTELKSPQKIIFWSDYCSAFGVVIGYITQDKRDTR